MSPKSTSGADRRARSEAMKAEREAAARASERRTRLLIAVAVVAAIALVAVAVIATRPSGGADAAVPAGVAAPDGGAPVGDSAAPVVMDEWVDFACPACKAFNAEFGEVINEQVEAGTLQVTYHPLSFVTPTGSKLAANAFGCAVDEGATTEYYDALFVAQTEETDEFTNERLLEVGATVGLEGEEFESCVTDGTYSGWVTNVADAGVAEGVTATPTIFLNGEELDLTQVPQAQDLVDAIEAAAAE